MGDSLLVDSRRIPALDRHVARLTRLIARACSPAMPDKEVCGRSKRIGAGADEVDMAVAVAVDTVADDVGREELRLANFAVRRALGGRAQVAPLHELQGGKELLGEKGRATAVIGKGGNRRQGVLVAQEAAE